MEFKGATTFPAFTVNRALENYRKEVGWAEQLLKEKVELAESEFKPSLWDKLRGKETLKDKYNNMFITYEGDLYMNNLISFNSYELERIRGLCSNIFYVGIWEYEEEYEQILNLSEGSSPYLNPEQAAFVNKYKVLKYG